MKLRKRPAVYIAIGGLVAMGIMLVYRGTLTGFTGEVNALIGTVVTGIVGLGHKAFESEEKGQDNADKANGHS